MKLSELARFVSTMNPSFSSIASYEIGGFKYAVATDEKMILAVRLDLLAPHELSDIVTGRYPVVLERIPQVPSSFKETTVEKILAWTGEAKWRVRCEKCEGRGYTSTFNCGSCKSTGLMACQCGCGDMHTKKCRRCGGTGKFAEEQAISCVECTQTGWLKYERPECGLFDGIPIDKKRLARLCAFVPKGPCMYWSFDAFGIYADNTDAAKGKCVTVRGDGWIAVLMTLIDVPKDRFEDEGVAPVADAPAVAIAL